MNLGPHELDTVITGDARELSKNIPDESIDLIFTDPVYNRIDDYSWLAETAFRVLKPDSACLVWIAPPRTYDVIDAMNKFMSFVMPFSYIRVASCNMIFSRRIFEWAKQCLWFEKGKSAVVKAVPDAVVSSGALTGNHKWNKNPEAIMKWLDAFTHPNDIVFDPFTGGGTVPAVCKMLARHYLAFEIDPTTAQSARERITITQAPSSSSHTHKIASTSSPIPHPLCSLSARPTLPQFPGAPRSLRPTLTPKTPLNRAGATSITWTR